MNKILFVILTISATNFLNAKNANAENTHSFGLEYGNVLTNPKELNEVIGKYNNALLLNGEKIKTVSKLGAYWEYSDETEWSFGLSLSKMSPSSSSSSGIASGSLDSSTYLYGLRAKYKLYSGDSIDIYINPTVGYAYYLTEANVLINGLDPTRVKANTGGIWGNLGIGIGYKFSKFFGITFDLGYQYASSNTLKVESQSNANLKVGEDYISQGVSMKVDSSGIYGSIGLVFSFDSSDSSNSSSTISSFANPEVLNVFKNSVDSYRSPQPVKNPNSSSNCRSVSRVVERPFEKPQVVTETQCD